MKYRPKTKFYKHQRKGLKHLWSTKRGGAAFWEPGTGKTKLALDFAASLHQRKWVKRVLVLCTINALQVWPDQAKDHIPSSVPWEMYVPEGSIQEKANFIRSIPHKKRLQFVILNYDAVSKRDKAWDMMQALVEYSPTLLVLDESQKVKRATTKRAKAAHRLSAMSKYVVLLTGTPMAKNYLDLYSQFKCIDPEIWDDQSWTRFKETYAIFGGRSGYELKRYVNIDDLKARFMPWATSALKRQCLDLPPVDDVIIPIKMNLTSRKAYDMFAKEGLITWRRHLIEAPIILTKLLRLQELSGGFVHDEMGEVIEFQQEKMAILKSLVEDLREANKRHLIFARFKREMDTIASVVNTDLVIRGGVSHKQRQLIVRRFIESDEPNSLIIQIGAGEALDGLQHVCSTAIYYSTDYSWESFGQSRGRLERSGQTEPITFYHLHMQATVDKLVYRALQNKRNLEREVMNDPSILIT